MALFNKKNISKFVITDIVLDKRVNDYELNNIKIISPIIKNIIDINSGNKSNEEIIYTQNLASISILLDSKFKDGQFTPHQKELMVESAFSQFQYLNKLNNTSIDDYLNTLDSHLDSISINNRVKYNGLHSSINKAIYLKDNILNNDLNLCTTFTHELNHCYRDNLVE